jgi:hypothetical protein
MVTELVPPPTDEDVFWARAAIDAARGGEKDG